MTQRKKAPSQSDKFKEAARELEADESEEAFDQKLRRIVKPKSAQGETEEKPE